jgi:hypothetical protein
VLPWLQLADLWTNTSAVEEHFTFLCTLFEHIAMLIEATESQSGRTIVGLFWVWRDGDQIKNCAYAQSPDQTAPVVQDRNGSRGGGRRGEDDTSDDERRDVNDGADDGDRDGDVAMAEGSDGSSREGAMRTKSGRPSSSGTADTDSLDASVAPAQQNGRASLHRGGVDSDDEVDDELKRQLAEKDPGL